MSLSKTRFVILTALVVAVVAGASGAALTDPTYKDRLSELKTALRPPPEDTPVDIDTVLATIKTFATLKDSRVIKELAKTIGPIEKRIVTAKEELDKATYKLEQVRVPHFEAQEKYYRKHGEFPDTILIRVRDALATLGKVQATKAQVYDSWIRTLDALYQGMEDHLAGLGEQRDAVWREVKKTLKSSKAPVVRAAFCKALRKLPEPKAEEILLDMAENDDEPEVMVAAIDALSRRRSVPALEMMLEQLDNPNWEVQIAAVYGLARYRDARTIPALVERLENAYGRISGDLIEVLFDLTGKHVPDTAIAWGTWWKSEGEKFMKRWSPDKEERRTAIQEIGMGDPQEFDVPAELAALLRTEPDADLRAEIVENLAIHKSGLARAVLIRTLRDDDKELRIAAIRALSHYQHLSVPDALMKVVPDADEDELLAIFQTLQKLWGGKREFTPQKPDKENLYRWWSNNKGRVLDHFATRGAIDAASSNRATKELEGIWQDRNFYGIRLVTQRVMFVVDISISMEDPQKEGEEIKKIQVAKNELKRAISSLPSDTVFGLICFANQAEVFEDGMMPATADNKKRVLAFVAALQTRAATNIYDTMELTFQIGTQDSPVKSDGMPDTVFFVSDGAPTVGKFTIPETILEHIARWNERRKVKIHAIGVGDDHDVDFLRKLADDHGGIYVAR